MSIIQNQSTFTIADITATYDKLPLGTYYLRYNERTGYYLEKVQDFILPSKLYGDLSIVDKWLKSHENTHKNTGIALTGLKGSGKTITAQKLCIDSKLPVIIIDTPYDDSDFISFITNSNIGNCVIFIDEFEKIYSNNTNSSTLLSLLDGNFQTHNIFIFTMNTNSLNEYMNNRPSRIKYKQHYESLSLDIVNEVIDDMLIYPEHKDEMLSIFQKVGILSFDLICSFIKEINLFGDTDSPKKCVLRMNIQPASVNYEVVEKYENNLFNCFNVDFDAFDDEIIIKRSFPYGCEKICPNYYDNDYCSNEKREAGLLGLDQYIVFKTSDLIKTKDGYIFTSEDEKSTFELTPIRIKSIF